MCAGALSFGGVAPGRVGRQHLVEELVSHTTLDKLVLGEDAIFVYVHFVEDLFCATLGRVLVARFR